MELNEVRLELGSTKARDAGEFQPSVGHDTLRCYSFIAAWLSAIQVKSEAIMQSSLTTLNCLAVKRERERERER